MSNLVNNLSRLQKDALRAVGCLSLDEKTFTKDWTSDKARIALSALPDDTVLVSSSGSCVRRCQNKYYYAPNKHAALRWDWQPLDSGFGEDLEPYNLLEGVTVEPPRSLTREEALERSGFYIVYQDGPRSWDHKYVSTRLNSSEAVLLEMAVAKGWPIVGTSHEAAAVISGLHANP